ncbi:capsid protein [Escherichia coli]|nr:capsid protein [Escherichia coli]PBO93806.1 capsid protein [Shigella sonnei]
MTAELRNLPHIASMAFNEPLMLEPAYAWVFFCALTETLTLSRSRRAVCLLRLLRIMFLVI